MANKVAHRVGLSRVTAVLLVAGVLFALVMGLVGGVPPAIRAARRPVVVALREL